jgi:hypothetical protein
MWETIKRLFENEILVALSSIWACIITFLFPTSTIATAAGAVMIIMCLDIVTKMFAIAKQNGGFRCAFKKHKITSQKFAKGTLDKLIIFGVMLIISGCAYNLMVIEEIATWFTQLVFTVMFLRDVLSILENLHDAGVQGLGLFKKLVKKKLDEYCDEEHKSDDQSGQVPKQEDKEDKQ